MNIIIIHVTKNNSCANSPFLTFDFELLFIPCEWLNNMTKQNKRCKDKKKQILNKQLEQQEKVSKTQSIWNSSQVSDKWWYSICKCNK